MKIAIMSGGPHNTIGGIESYNSNLISMLNKKHDVVEFSLYPGRKIVRDKIIDINFIQKKNSYISNILSLRNNKKLINKISKEYDLVIISGGHWVYNYNLDNVVYVQHFANRYYRYKNIGIDLKIKYAIDSIFSLTSFKPNPVKKSKNVVYFNKTTFYPGARVDQNKFTAPTSMIKGNFSKAGSGYIFIGRIENRQKNVINLAKNEPGLITYYGHGEKTEKLKKIVGKRYKGILKHSEVSNVLRNAKALVLPSKFEGMPIVIAEAASVGTPSIILDTYEMANFYEEKSISKIIKNISDLSDLESISVPDRIKVYESFKEELSYEVFIKKWENIISHFQK